MNITEERLCTGCMLCVSVCPCKAVKVSKKHHNGYYYPKIDETICTGCGLCREKCPQNDKRLFSEQYRNENVYLGWSKDRKLRRSSSSGGVFGELAGYILSKGGVVIGAAYSSDYTKVMHVAIDDVRDLSRLRPSKYVQSDTSNIWEQVKQFVKDGRYVLFSGLPCHIDALRHLYSDFPENLYAVDLVCRGIPSPVLWSEYVSNMKKQWGSEIEYINYRHKGEFGWTQRKVAIRFKDGREYISTRSEDIFAKLFFDNVVIRDSCINCRYSAKERIGDLTLGDFWALKNSDVADKEDGLSMILVNSKKGEILLNSVSGNVIISKMDDIRIDRNNSGLGEKLCKNEKAKGFWKNYEEFGFDLTVENYLAESETSNRNLHNGRVYFNLLDNRLADNSLADLLFSKGVEKIYIYGIGVNGTILHDLLCDDMEIVAYVDKKSHEKGIKKFCGMDVLSPDCIPEDRYPVLISPSYYYQSISYELIKNDVNRKRIISLAMLLEYGFRYESTVLETIILLVYDSSNISLAVERIRELNIDLEIHYAGIQGKVENETELDKKGAFRIKDNLTLHSEWFELFPCCRTILIVGDVSETNSLEWEKVIYIAEKYEIPIKRIDLKTMMLEKSDYFTGC